MKYVENALRAALVGLSLISIRTATGQETVIHTFGSTQGPDGSSPEAGLFIDPKGDLFGTTFSGGTYGYGIAFELSPVKGGSWKETVLYNFNYDQANPDSALISDGKGNLYGTTARGGFENDFEEGGTVFELSPVGDGSWNETKIYSFGSYVNDGTTPSGGLTFDGKGNIYGTTQTGGPNYVEYAPGQGAGTVFELTPLDGGTWTEKVLYSFGATSTDGTTPEGGVVLDSSGNLFGTTSSGGPYSSYYPFFGTVFELTPKGDGSWTEGILHSFGHAFGAVGEAGGFPTGSLIQDGKGNLYGTTLGGTVFELSPSTGGTWLEKVILEFSQPTYPPYINTSGTSPYAGVIMDAKGNLYGTTSDGGIYSYQFFIGGTAYELVPQADGSWMETVLHDFPSTPNDGDYVIAGVILDAKGNLYGTTEAGGAFRYGTVFEIEAVPGGAPVETATTLASSPSFSANNPYYGPIAGEPITLSARVVSAVVGAVPTGSVTFTATTGGSITVPLTAGVAVYSGTVPSPGPYSIYARYNGGDGFAPSDSSTATALVSTHTITTLTSTPSTNLVSGGPITLTATVRSTIGKAIPTGTVTFVDLAGRMAFEPLVDGVAVYSGIVPSPGVFSIFASYSGATEFLESNSATLTRTVTAPSPQ